MNNIRLFIAKVELALRNARYPAKKEETIPGSVRMTLINNSGHFANEPKEPVVNATAVNTAIKGKSKLTVGEWDLINQRWIEE